MKANGHSWDHQVNYFSKIKVRINLQRPNNKVYNKFVDFFEKWINQSLKRQNLYENSFLRIFPARSIETLLIK